MDRSANMRAIRSKDMKPEMAVRRLVHSMGYRYRLHRHALPGRPDMVFPGRRKVVFVHGCFWHQHDIPSCKTAHMPKSNLDYWKPKLERNKARDLANGEALRSSGWDVLVVWECEIGREDLAQRLASFLDRSSACGSQGTVESRKGVGYSQRGGSPMRQGARDHAYGGRGR